LAIDSYTCDPVLINLEVWRLTAILPKWNTAGFFEGLLGRLLSGPLGHVVSARARKYALGVVNIAHPIPLIAIYSCGHIACPATQIIVQHGCSRPPPMPADLDGLHGLTRGLAALRNSVVRATSMQVKNWSRFCPLALRCFGPIAFRSRVHQLSPPQRVRLRLRSFPENSRSHPGTT
jgi:hypothetical protein